MCCSYPIQNEEGCWILWLEIYGDWKLFLLELVRIMIASVFALSIEIVRNHFRLATYSKNKHSRSISNVNYSFGRFNLTHCVQSTM